MRATRVSLPLAAVAALTLVPVTQAAAQPDDLVPAGTTNSVSTPSRTAAARSSTGRR